MRRAARLSSERLRPTIIANWYEKLKSGIHGFTYGYCARASSRSRVPCARLEAAPIS